MTPKKEDDDSHEKRTIEFDMFVRDLEPDQDEKIRGGGKSGDQTTPDDAAKGTDSRQRACALSTRDIS